MLFFKDLLIEGVVEGVAYDPHDFTSGGNQILVTTAPEVCKSWLTAVKWKTWQEDPFMKLPNEKEIFKSFANNIVCSQIAKLFRAKSIIKESISIREKPNVLSFIKSKISWWYPYQIILRLSLQQIRYKSIIKRVFQ